jgi:hypothetical protein
MGNGSSPILCDYPLWQARVFFTSRKDEAATAFSCFCYYPDLRGRPDAYANHAYGTLGRSTALPNGALPTLHGMTFSPVNKVTSGSFCTGNLFPRAALKGRSRTTGGFDVNNRPPSPLPASHHHIIFKLITTTTTTRLRQYHLGVSAHDNQGLGHPPGRLHFRVSPGLPSPSGTPVFPPFSGRLDAA